MTRTRNLAALLIAALIAASIFLVIQAADNDLPPPTIAPPPEEHENDQQQAQSQAEPQPPETEAEDEQMEAEEAEAAEQAEPEQPEPEQEQAAAETEDAEEPALAMTPESPPLDDANVVDVIIRTLEIERTLPRTTRPRDARPRDGVHIVQKRENLSVIAAAYGVAVWELARFNDLDQAAILSVGTKLRIPPAKDAADEPPPPTYAPNEMPPTRIGPNTVAGTVHDRARGMIHTVVVAFADPDPPDPRRSSYPINGDLRLAVACVDGALRVWLQLSPEAELGEARPPVPVYWQFDGAGLNADRWKLGPGMIESTRPRLLLEAALDADALWLRADLNQQTFQGAFSTQPIHSLQVLPNLLNCGN